MKAALLVRAMPPLLQPGVNRRRMIGKIARPAYRAGQCKRPECAMVAGRSGRGGRRGEQRQSYRCLRGDNVTTPRDTPHLLTFQLRI